MRRFISEISDIWTIERPNQLAAALAYYGMFSFAPVIYIGVSIAGIFIDQFAIASQLYGRLEQIFGTQTAALVQSLVQAASDSHAGSTVIISLISFLALFYAASGLFFQLQFALNRVWGISPQPKGQTRAFIRHRLFSFIMVIGVGLLLVLATLVNVILAWFGSFFGLGSTPMILTLAATVGLATFSFALLYKILPDVHIAWRDVWPGAFAAALLVMLAGMVATLYFRIGRVGSALEAAGAFAVLLIAIYYVAQIFLLGAVITRAFASRGGYKNNTATRPKESR